MLFPLLGSRFFSTKYFSLSECGIMMWASEGLIAPPTCTGLLYFLYFSALESENSGQGWGTVERSKKHDGIGDRLAMMDRRVMKLCEAWSGIGLGDSPRYIRNKYCFSNCCLLIHSCGCLGEAQENVFTALGDHVMRIICTLNVEGTTPGTHLTHGRNSCGKTASVFWPGPFCEKMPIEANINTQTKQQQHRIPQSLRLRHSFLSFLNKRLSNTCSEGEPVKENAAVWRTASYASPTGTIVLPF